MSNFFVKPGILIKDISKLQVGSVYVKDSNLYLYLGTWGTFLGLKAKIKLGEQSKNKCIFKAVDKPDIICNLQTIKAEIEDKIEEMKDISDEEVLQNLDCTKSFPETLRNYKKDMLKVEKRIAEIFQDMILEKI